MNISLGTFLKLGLTALTIVILLFGVGFAMVDGETDDLNTVIQGVSDKLPKGSANN